MKFSDLRKLNSDADHETIEMQKARLALKPQNKKMKKSGAA